MRKLTFLCAIICFGLMAAAQNGEEQNIRKALQDFVDAYNSPDSSAWKKNWVHDATVTNTFSSRDFYRETVGWDSLQAVFDRQQTANAGDKFENKNIAIKTNDNLAMADFDMVYTPANPADIFPYTGSLTYHNYILLVKDNGQWKVNKRVVTLPVSYTAGLSAENDLNSAGYNLLSANKLKEAIEVFRLNAKLYPTSWNVFDSLGEALAAAGNKKEAIENYEKSVKLNPKSESGKAALIKLKQK